MSGRVPPGGVPSGGAESGGVASRTSGAAGDVDELGSRIVGLAGRIAAASGRWLLLVAEFDSAHGFEQFGLPSTARWLSHACGISHRTAVDHVRVARALVSFPALASALDSARISYCHARAIARLAQPGEHQLVSDLLAVAEHGTVGQLETVVRSLRTVEQNESGESELGGSESNGPAGVAGTSPHDAEYVRHGWASRTSLWRMSARLDPERGALVENAVAKVAEAEGITHVDALVRLAEIALAALNHRADGPPRTLRGDERAAVVLHVTAAAVPSEQSSQPSTSNQSTSRPCAPNEPAVSVTALLAGAARPRSRERGDQAGPLPFAWLDDGPGLPRRVVERLLCACRVRPVVHAADGSILDLGRTRRVVDDRLLRALMLRDRHCAFPGCRSRHKLEAHHVIHWLHGGRTDLANLVMLCVRHHHQHHDGEFGIERVGTPRRGSFLFRRHDGVVLEAHVDPSRHITSGTPPVETEYPQIPDQAIRSKTIGDRLDRDWATAVLAQRRQEQRAA